MHDCSHEMEYEEVFAAKCSIAVCSVVVIPIPLYVF